MLFQQVEVIISVLRKPPGSSLVYILSFFMNRFFMIINGLIMWSTCPTTDICFLQSSKLLRGFVYSVTPVMTLTFSVLHHSSSVVLVGPDGLLPLPAADTTVGLDGTSRVTPRQHDFLFIVPFGFARLCCFQEVACRQEVWKMFSEYVGRISEPLCFLYRLRCLDRVFTRCWLTSLI